ncbi:MAG: glycosyltransferase, partial [Chloroflexota bacterium]
MITNVIPTYNRKRVLLWHLRELEQQTFKDFEVIVVSDGSSDGSVKAARKLKATFPLTVLEQADQGFRLATARNLGIQQARFDIVVLTDDDQIPRPQLFALYAEHVRRGHAVLGYTTHVKHLGDRQIWWWAGPNMAIHRQDLLDVGGYDEEIKLYGAEDFDLALRLRLNGVTFSFRPEAMSVEVPGSYVYNPISEQAKYSQIRVNFAYLKHKFAALGVDLAKETEGFFFHDVIAAL